MPLDTWEETSPMRYRKYFVDEVAGAAARLQGARQETDKTEGRGVASAQGHPPLAVSASKGRARSSD